METEKITEKMLLEHYEGVSNDGVTARSRIDGQVVWWTYRMAADGIYQIVTSDRTEAEIITLENDRIGKIELDEAPTTQMVARAVDHDVSCRAQVGTIIYGYGRLYSGSIGGGDVV